MAMFIWELSFLIGWLIKEKLAVQIYESVSESMTLNSTVSQLCGVLTYQCISPLSLVEIVCDVIQLSNSLCPDAPEVGGRHPTGATVHDHSQLDSVVRWSPSCSLDEVERVALFIWELLSLILPPCAFTVDGVGVTPQAGYHPIVTTSLLSDSLEILQQPIAWLTFQFIHVL